MNGGHGGGRGGGGGNQGYQQGYGSPSVKTYDYVDPKAGSRTRLVEMVKGKSGFRIVDLRKKKEKRTLSVDR